MPRREIQACRQSMADEGLPWNWQSLNFHPLTTFSSFQSFPFLPTGNLRRS